MQSFLLSVQSSSCVLQLKPKISTWKCIKASNENDKTQQQTPRPSSDGGKLKRLVLDGPGRTKLNVGPDQEFYSYPRFVTHVDDGFISTLTELYRDRVRPGSDVLDLMSSWVSHLPGEVRYVKRVLRLKMTLTIKRCVSTFYCKTNGKVIKGKPSLTSRGLLHFSIL